MSTNMRLGLWSAAAGVFFTFLREILKLSNVNEFLVGLGEPGENTIALLKTLLPYSSWIGLAMLSIGVLMIVKSLARKAMRLVVGWTGGSLGALGTIKNIITSTVEDAKIDKWVENNSFYIVSGLAIFVGIVAVTLISKARNNNPKKKQYPIDNGKDYYDSPIEPQYD